MDDESADGCGATAVSRESAVNRERATAYESADDTERAAKSESAVDVERAPAQERATKTERAVSNESVEMTERASVGESAAPLERATKPESAVRSERANVRESAEEHERAELPESTEPRERAATTESANPGERPHYSLGYPHIEEASHHLWDAQQDGWPNHLPFEAWRELVKLQNELKQPTASSADHPAFQANYAPNFLASQEQPPAEPAAPIGAKVRR